MPPNAISNSTLDPERTPRLSPLKLAVLALEQLKNQVTGMKRERTEPIAIVGIGCRFPGQVQDLHSFRQLLSNGVDAIEEIPASRWDWSTSYNANPDNPDTAYVNACGFITGVDQFDPDFFGISPREAVAMDPQQRLLLEICWQALEQGGIAPDSLKDTPSGVFVGINNSDYARLQPQLSTYGFTGTTFSVAAGRLAYSLGLHGPALALDTACSSSLVSVHLACQSLRTQECNLALAGGVNLILSPQGNITLSRMRALAPDGRCKTFDAAADGYGRGEGCGIVVLKRFSDAYRDRNQILGVIRGSAVNHDGTTSGLTVPNGIVQQRLLRAALANAQVSPEQIGYVEAHGTGTTLGDPIEIEALNQVLCQGRSHNNPLTIASVKTNIGHLEAAAGIAGLIKTVITLRSAAFAPHLHFNQPNPLVDWANIPMVIPTETTPWPPPPHQARLAGVSSFGMSGTNAHLILQEPPAIQSPDSQNDRSPDRSLQSEPHLLILSAKNETALETMVEDWIGHLQQQPDLAFADVCYTAAVGRSALAERLAVFATTAPEACAKLQHWLDTPHSGQVFRGTVANSQAPKVAFIVPDSGSDIGSDQVPRTGTGAKADDPRPLWISSQFSQTRDLCYQIYQQVQSERQNSNSVSTLNPSNLETIPQGTIPELVQQFAHQYAQAQLWLAWGIEPQMLLGQGVGEYVAACLAGIFSLEAAMGILLAQATWANAVAQGTELEAAWEQWQAVAASVSYSEPTIGMVSHTTGTWAIPSELIQPSYWCSKVCPLTNLDQGEDALAQRGCDIRISVQPEQLDREQCLLQLAKLYLQGATINWNPVYPDPSYRRLSLPTYPFQRSRYWIETSPDPITSSLDQTWSYQIKWQVQEGTETIVTNQCSELFCRSGKWLILADRRYGIGQALANQLAAQGESSLLVFAEDQDQLQQFQAIPSDSQYLSLHDPEQFGQQLAQVVDQVMAQGCCGVIHLWSLDATPIAATTTASLNLDHFRTCGTVLHLVQTLAQYKATTATPRLYLVSQNAQPVNLDLSSSPLALAQASLWGLGRSIALEHPELWGKLIDLPSLDFHISLTVELATVANLATELLGELKHTDSEDQVVLRLNQRYVPRLVPVANPDQSPGQSPPEQSHGPVAITDAGTYLITGGLGALGLQMAGWLVDRGAKSIVLVGRRTPKPSNLEIINILKQSGAQVLVEQADVADTKQVECLFLDLAQHPTMPPLAGIFHLAGVLDDGVLLRQSWQRFSHVLAPKVLGGWNLHQQSQDLALDFFVCFSSIASVLGSPGQSNYAAANAFLDGLAHDRQRQGLPSFSFNWSPWAESGMAADLGNLGEQRWKALGVDLITPEQGLKLLDRLLSRDQKAQTALLPITWSRFFERYPIGAGPTLLADIAATVLGRDSSGELTPHPGATQPLILQQLQGLSPEETQGKMVAYLQQTAATVLGRGASQLPRPHQGFFEMGMDSLLALEFGNSLRASLGSALPTSLLSTLTFDYPTIDVLATYLINQVLPDLSPQPPSADPETSPKLDQTIDDIQQLSESDLMALFDRELDALGIQN
jgi:acyl transferase domain-containing protein